MGCYINPKDGTKEEWLKIKGIVTGRLCSPPDSVPEYNSFKGVPVVLIHNGPFTAAGVAYSPEEYEAFTMTPPDDDRPRLIFDVPDDQDLEAVSGISQYRKRRQ